MKKKDLIARELMIHLFQRGDIVIPGYFIDHWEADMLMIRRSGLVYEFEIKTTRADFLADFKKNASLWKGGKLNKHDQTKNGHRNCNRFFFVIPEGTVPPELIPAYAGLITCRIDGERVWFREVRNGKLLRPKYQINWEEIARKLAFREYHLRIKMRNIDETLEELRHDVRFWKSQAKQKDPELSENPYAER